MTTRKLNHFEYAGLVQQGQTPLEGLCRQDGFETPNGYAFVLVSSGVYDEQQAGLAGVAMERVRYYLEHETEEDIHAAAINALVYTSGFIYQMSQKDSAVLPGQLSCVCGLFRDGQVSLAWVGDVCAQLFTGKKPLPLTWLPKNIQDNGQPTWYLGLEPLIKPEATATALVPENGDILLLASHEVCMCLQLKAMRRIIQDSMPLQTKVARITRMAMEGSSGATAALLMVGFYNMSGNKRTFIQGSPYDRKRTVEQPGETMPEDDEHGMKKQSKGKISKRNTNLLFRILALVALIAVAYMVYDLFLHDPRPPVRIPTQSPPAAVEETTPPSSPVVGEEAAPLIPDDVAYNVRQGDTWSRIYNQFGVCSWFIINHTPNTGRFGREGALIAGERLMIPVVYSGRQELNPDFYHEFSIDKVGSGCQQAGREFLNSFQELISN